MATLRVKTDYPTIQAAVDAAQPGDTILVEDGTYNEQVLVSKDYLKIIGAGKAILDGGMNTVDAFILNGTSGVLIKTFIIKNYRNDGIDIYSGKTNTISDICFLDINRIGVLCDTNTSDNQITNCSIKAAYYGISNGGNNLTVEDCRISWCGNAAIYGLGQSSNITVRRCFIHNNGEAAMRIFGPGAHITGNRLDKNWTFGIEVSANSLVEGNEVSNTIEGYGIYLENNCIARKNRVCSNDLNGITTGAANAVLCNEVTGNGAAGIVVFGENSIAEGNFSHHNEGYDIVRIMANNIVRNNDCGKSLPPWLCDACAAVPDPVLPKTEGDEMQDACNAVLRVPGDYSTIQAAVDAARVGDVIFVESGVYHEQVQVGTSLITLMGTGKTVLDGEMTLESGILLNGTAGVEVRRFIIRNYKSYGIGISAGGRNCITATAFLDCNISGVSLDAGTQGNRITRCFIAGAHVGVTDNSSGLAIDKSEISWNGQYGVLSSGNTQVCDCTLRDNFDTGIGGTQSGMHIMGCKVSGSGRNGITASDYSVIEGSEISGSATYGVLLNGIGNTVKSNKTRLNAQYGIYSHTGNNAITGNCVSKSQIGITVFAGNLIEKNTICGNSIYDIRRAEPDCTIRNNNCEKGSPPWICSKCCAEPQVLPPACEDISATIRVPQDYPTIQAAVDAAVPGDVILVEKGVYPEQVTVNKNLIRIIGKAGAVLNGGFQLDAGITIENAVNIEIRSFIIKNYKTYGMHITGSSTGINVSGVRILNATYGIYLATPTANNQIHGSTMIGNIVGVYNLGSNFFAENCRFLYNSNPGFYSYCDHTTITDCVSGNNGGNGIGIGLPSGSATVTGNKVYGNRKTSLITYGICLIKGNDVSDNYSGGISVIGANSVVEENRVCNNTNGGISVSGGVGVRRNHVCWNAIYGIIIGSTKNIVEGNTAEQNENYDILRSQANNICRDNICGTGLPPWVCEKCSPETVHTEKEDLI